MTPNPNENEDVQKLLVVILGLLVVGGLIVISQVFSENPFIVYGAVVLVGVWFGGWTIGCAKGRRLRDEAEEIQAKAQKQRQKSQTLLNQTTQTERRLQERIAENHRLELALSAMGLGDNARVVCETRELPLDRLVHAVIMVGLRDGESHAEYRDRRAKLVESRVAQWQHAKRWGHELLPLVKRQGGLCGDPDRDPGTKGCGCYLYCLPPSAVHLDHIKPRKTGGPNNLENVQALCNHCNISAGARDRSAHDVGNG